MGLFSQINTSSPAIKPVLLSERAEDLTMHIFNTMMYMLSQSRQQLPEAGLGRRWMCFACKCGCICVNVLRLLTHKDQTAYTPCFVCVCVLLLGCTDG